MRKLLLILGLALMLTPWAGAQALVNYLGCFNADTCTLTGVTAGHALQVWASYTSNVTITLFDSQSNTYVSAGQEYETPDVGVTVAGFLTCSVASSGSITVTTAPGITLPFGKGILVAEYSGQPATACLDQHATTTTGPGATLTTAPLTIGGTTYTPSFTVSGGFGSSVSMDIFSADHTQARITSYVWTSGTSIDVISPWSQPVSACIRCDHDQMMYDTNLVPTNIGLGTNLIRVTQDGS